MRIKTGLLWVVLSAAGVVWGGNSIRVEVDQPGTKISPMLWGIFFEDINLSTDGGIYAELVRNRSFEDSDKPEHWSVVSSGNAEVKLSIDRERPLGKRNRSALKVEIGDVGVARAGVVNSGYYGMSVVKGAIYDLTFFVRSADGFGGPLQISLESNDSRSYARTTVKGLSTEWQQCKVVLKAGGSDPKARLVISSEKAGTFWLDGVSLMPRDTWKGQGFRKDLVEMLVGLEPAFMRFPGGCWVEGNYMRESYRWKETIGDIWERRSQFNLWGYTATHGIGYHEYLLLSETLGAEPMFCINAGMSHREVVPLDEMGEWVQDALDAIEYANGGSETKWGAERAKAGHPAPFNMKYIQIGNENGGPRYNERYALFYDAIKARYPEITIIANDWGGVPNSRPLEIIDEHYYNNPEFFMEQAYKYDKYDRNGYKVFVGEYAVTRNTGEGSLRGAIGEAAFMTGMERNSDVVVMAAYAPLFVHANHRRWNPDLIVFDSSRVHGIPSYYVQQLFAQHRGDTVVPCSVESEPAEAPTRRGMVGVGGWNTKVEYRDVKVVRGSEVLYASDFGKGSEGWKFKGSGWKCSDGSLKLEEEGEGYTAVVGSPEWSDYTLTLKARKNGGSEGFLIMIGAEGVDHKSWWNLGGWGNKKHGLEIAGAGVTQVEGSIESGRWYDIRVELMGGSVKCYLDDKLVHDAATKPLDSLFASAALTADGGEVIVKVVNTSATARVTKLELGGVAGLGKSGKGWVLTHSDAMAENSLKEPRRVVPVAFLFKLDGDGVTRSFPGNSFSVLRVPLKR